MSVGLVVFSSIVYYLLIHSFIIYDVIFDRISYYFYVLGCNYINYCPEINADYDAQVYYIVCNYLDYCKSYQGLGS